MCGIQRELDVGRPRARALGELLAGARRDVRPVRAGRRRDERAADEVVVALLQRDRTAGLPRRCVGSLLLRDGHCGIPFKRGRCVPAAARRGTAPTLTARRPAAIRARCPSASVVRPRAARADARGGPDAAPARPGPDVPRARPPALPVTGGMSLPRALGALVLSLLATGAAIAPQAGAVPRRAVALGPAG